MRTIKIISEAGATETYRAICENQQATGATPGQALDAIERELAAKGIKQNGTTVAIVQRSSKKLCQKQELGGEETVS